MKNVNIPVSFSNFLKFSLNEEGGNPLPKLDFTNSGKKDIKIELKKFKEFIKDEEKKFWDKLVWDATHKKPLTQEQKDYLEGKKRQFSNQMKRISSLNVPKLSDSLEQAAGKKILGKNIINIKGNSYLQAILVNLGLLVSKIGPDKNGITGYFNGETESALEKLTGRKYVNFRDEEGKNKFNESLIESGYHFNEKFMKECEKLRDSALKKKKKELRNYIDTGSLGYVYDYIPWGEKGPLDYQLKLTGDILDDMFIYNSLKEGGLSDDPKDSGPAASPCPYEFDAKTGVLNYKGKTIKLNSNPHLINSKSTLYGGSKSDKWHTSRGIVWPTWKAAAAILGITNEEEVVKKYFEMSDENVKNVYKKSFYDVLIKNQGKETKSPLVNHCLATGFWGSLVHGNNTITNSLAELNKYGYTSFNDAIQKAGEKFVTEVVLDVQSKLYLSYEKAKVYGKGWLRGMANFHRYFVPTHADKPEKIEYPKESKEREDLGSLSYSGLDKDLEYLS
jgi:hypothetical protein